MRALEDAEDTPPMHHRARKSHLKNIRYFSSSFFIKVSKNIENYK